MRKLIRILIVAAILALAWIFVDRSVLVVKDVEVTGAREGEAADVIRISGIDMGGSMRKLNAKSAALNVESTGVYSCIAVEKKYPSTVVISVMPRRMAAVIEAGGFMVTLDEAGYVMNVSAAMPEGDYVYVTGVEARRWELGRQIEADADRLSALVTVVNALNKNGAQSYVSEVNVSDKNTLYAYSRTGIYVLLGDADNMDRKVVWMTHALADLESRGETSGRLDVSGGDKADYSAN
jgi:cell division protein FtsQ